MTEQQPSAAQADSWQVEQEDWRAHVPLPPIDAAPRRQVLVPLLVYTAAGAGFAAIVLALFRYVVGSLW